MSEGTPRTKNFATTVLERMILALLTLLAFALVAVIIEIPELKNQPWKEIIASVITRPPEASSTAAKENLVLTTTFTVVPGETVVRSVPEGYGLQFVQNGCVAMAARKVGNLHPEPFGIICSPGRQPDPEVILEEWPNGAPSVINKWVDEVDGFAVDQFNFRAVQMIISIKEKTHPVTPIPLGSRP